MDPIALLFMPHRRMSLKRVYGGIGEVRKDGNEIKLKSQNCFNVRRNE